jgi:hypothetical protein
MNNHEIYKSGQTIQRYSNLIYYFLELHSVNANIHPHILASMNTLHPTLMSTSKRLGWQSLEIGEDTIDASLSTDTSPTAEKIATAEIN